MNTGAPGGLLGGRGENTYQVKKRGGGDIPGGGVVSNFLFAVYTVGEKERVEFVHDCAFEMLGFKLCIVCFTVVLFWKFEILGFNLCFTVVPFQNHFFEPMDWRGGGEGGGGAGGERWQPRVSFHFLSSSMFGPPPYYTTLHFYVS